MEYRKDFEVGAYQPLKHPVVSLSGRIEDVPFTKQVQRNIFLQLLQTEELIDIERRIKSLKENLSYIFSLIYDKYPNLKILQISIGGSYGYEVNDNIGDIDFNVIVKGSFFAYYDVFDIDELRSKLNISISKISFMIFGEDNLKGIEKIEDSILSKSFLHTDMTIREGTVMYFRNVWIYGQDFLKISMNDYNFKMRIRRQLFQAFLLLNGEIGIEYGTTGRQRKAFSRIREAGILMSLNFAERSYWKRLSFSIPDIQSLYKKVLNKLEEA